jgi:DNA mismatch repair protein MutL
MNRADARLAFLPHATSKIRALADLDGTISLGFRGEALASIASVARVTLVTRCRGAASGTATRVLAAGGEIREVEDAGAPPGTSVTVEDLFYNTPPRQKFLKSLQTELAQLTGALEALAISHPRVVFQLLHNGRERLATRQGPDLLEAIRAVYGDEAAGDLIPLLAERPALRVEGYISTPFFPRKTPSRVLISINGRPVFSRQVIRAIRKGYGTLLPSHTYPSAFLDLRIDPSRVDVNVHPTKRHVRIGEEQEILSVIEEAVRESLREEDLRGSRWAVPRPGPPRRRAHGSPTGGSGRQSFRQGSPVGRAWYPSWRSSGRSPGRTSSRGPRRTTSFSSTSMRPTSGSSMTR